MKFEEEISQFAKIIVDECKHSFLNKEDIINNFKDYGFLVNANKMIGYTSYLEYNRNKNRGSISYSVEESQKKQAKILLHNFCAFILSDEENVKFYYKNFPKKNEVKKISKYIVQASVEKEFPIDNDYTLYSKKTGGIKK